MMTTKELRETFLQFFEKEGHTRIPSASLIPDNDPTVLFTTAGMHPLVPYLLGESHPGGTRLTDVQKCVRTGDIDEVGDKSHLTFFEMLGNWSLGDYFKQEAIQWSFDFLTKELGIPVEKLAVSVFAGDDDAPFDQEAYDAWLALGIAEERIAKLPKKNNWWGPAGQTGPCGPDTEMFYWVGEGEPHGNPGDNEDEWLEIWNDVFMQYNKQEDGSFVPLTQQNVDTGMGLERTVAVLSGFDDVYRVDTLWPIVEKVAELSQKSYEESPEVTQSLRVISDHLRTATMIMGDNMGIAPGNMDQAYVVRKLIRRAIRHGRNLGIEGPFCADVATQVIELFGEVYGELQKNANFVQEQMAQEEEKFSATLASGLKEFEKLLAGFQKAFEHTGNKVTEISGKQAFKLYDTYGFPLEMTEELASEHGLTVDTKGFDAAFEKHQELSRKGAEQKFAGGLADHSEMSVKYHTATHLLHATLKKVLGDHVEQRGSNITPKRLRFDFSHPQKMTDEEKKQVEDLINGAIAHDYPVSWQEMSVAEAKEKGAIGLFEEKYGDTIKVYTIGDPKERATANPDDPTYSMEICGGPHVERTGTLGHFRIAKEQASSAGIRRIKAILE
jgi:alanyl-tRNA synthetase